MIRFFLFVLLVIALCGCLQSRQIPSPEQLFEAYQGEKTPGAAVLVARDGEILFESAFGSANLENSTPVTLHANFRLASVTKQFTALAVLQLVAEGKVALETTLPEIFDGFPDYGDDITIQHLLRHTSGLIDYESLIRDTTTVQLLDLDVLRSMKAQDSTYFPPGSSYRYSNSAYVLLGLAVEQISGKPFADYLQSFVFQPAGMETTVAYLDGYNEVESRAFGYKPTENGFEFADQSRTSALLGDGGIYSSVRDLLAWDNALRGAGVLSQQWLDQAWIPGDLTTGEPTNYGYGWRIDTFLGHRRTHHTGSTSGFRNVLQRFPDDGLFIVILTNRSEPDPAPIADELARRYLEPVTSNP